ncbi:MAG: glycosyltransferase family 2 protein [Halobacteriota archaeon]|nr:glycosyltransferase family 2 protein [Halobacteriota archaeon]
MQNNSKDYIVVTPCKNEEKNLPNVILSITSQTIKPKLWIIVDDGSSDQSLQIISKAESEYAWISKIRLEKSETYMGTHIARVCKSGFDYAIEYCKDNTIPFDFIALVDADNILEERYFEKLLLEFKKDERLGIASGNSAFLAIEENLRGLRTENEDINVMNEEFWQLFESPRSRVQSCRDDLPTGSARIWRKACFEETGGYLPVPLPDSVSNAKAKMKGWKTRRFNEVKIIEREGHAKQGLWNGYKEKGESYFILGQSVSFAFIKSINYSRIKPHYIGIAYFYGYVISFMKGIKRVDDEEILRYYRSIHQGYYIKKLKGIFTRN